MMNIFTPLPFTDYKHTQRQILSIQAIPLSNLLIIDDKSKGIPQNGADMLSSIDESHWPGCARELLTLFLQGRFESVLDHLMTRKMLGISQELGDPTLSPWGTFLKDVETSLTLGMAEESEAEEKQYQAICWLLVATSCLHLFRQANWTGPITALWQNISWMPSHALLDEWTKSAFDALTCDSQLAYKLAHQPILLLLSELIMTRLIKLQADCLACHWMLCRCLFTKQYLYTHHCPSIWEQFKIIRNERYKELEIFVINYPELVGELRVEFALMSLYYYDYDKCSELLEKQTNEMHLELKVAGAMGKRTKFQLDAKAQLVLMITQKKEIAQLDYHFPTLAYTDKIDNIPLNDDTLLEVVQLSGENVTYDIDLAPLHQALILAKCREISQITPKHAISQETISAYLCPLISRPTIWSVQAAVLYWRSILESDASRKIERAMKQLDAIVNMTHNNEPYTSLYLRLSLLYTVPLPPRWQIRCELAHILKSLGCNQSAQDIYYELQMWDDVVNCMQSMGKLAKAEELVKKLIEENETPDLWCSLGDITNKPLCYETAWKLSKNRSFRAQKCLGQYYLNYEKNYEKAFGFFEKSLELNSLQISLWFQFGWVALKTGKPETAVKAYQMNVSLDPENGEAWSNLATAFLKMGSKMQAFKALQEAGKHSFGNWHIMDNFLTVGTDIGQFSEVIVAYHRLLDTKPKHVAIDVLKALVSAVTTNKLDANNNPSSSHRTVLLVLFGRITAMVTEDSLIWEFYGDLQLTSDKIVDKTKGCTYLQKAHSIVKQDNTWNKSIENAVRTVKLSCKLLQAMIDTVNHDIDQKLISVSSATAIKLAVNSTLKICHGMNEDLNQIEMPNEQLNSGLVELDKLYDIFIKQYLPKIITNHTNK